MNLQSKFKLIEGYYKPAIVGELNGQHVKLAKFLGAFPMHKHDNEDELFLVVKGTLNLDFGDRVEVVNEGEFVIVPRGVMHRPIADDEVHALMFEPASTLNTGSERNEFTVDSPKRL